MRASFATPCRREEWQRPVPAGCHRSGPVVSGARFLSGSRAGDRGRTGDVVLGKPADPRHHAHAAPPSPAASRFPNARPGHEGAGRRTTCAHPSERRRNRARQDHARRLAGSLPAHDLCAPEILGLLSYGSHEPAGGSLIALAMQRRVSCSTSRNLCQAGARNGWTGRRKSWCQTA